MHSYISGIILHCSRKPQSSKLGKLVILCPIGCIFFLPTTKITLTVFPVQEVDIKQ